jgi:DNA mismatch repair protein MutS2
MHYRSLVESEERVVREAVGREESYQHKLKALERREKEFKTRAAQEAEAILARARAKVEAVVKEIREGGASRQSIIQGRRDLEEARSEAAQVMDEQPPAPAPAPIPKARETAAEKAETEEPPRARHLDREPEVGDYVDIDSSGTIGQVTAASHRASRVCVAVGSVGLWISRARVAVVEPPEREMEVRVFATLPEVPFELDVRGLDAPEAAQRVQRYLEDGAAAGRKTLGIIHGKGAGILSRNIRQMLKEHPLVADFRYGEYGAGDYGITIVELKGGG